MAKKVVEDEYKLLSQEEQILLRPDTVIGSIVEQTKQMWSFFDNNQILKQQLTYIPGFLKLFDEILTNASDHAQRGKGVKNIKIYIDDSWNIKVWNDGDGIPIVIHKEHNLYIPEMVLGRLNSGSNYNDNEERYGAGRNGVGSGAVALFSSKFIIDCADGKKSYYQELTNNAREKTQPVIKSSTKSYTCVSYTTDITRLPILPYSDDTLKLCKKRIYDIAVYNPKVNVYFNDELIKINNITDWASMHLCEGDELFVENINEKWAIALSQSSTDNFEQCSIVNGNTTWQGGTHVDYVMNQIVKRLTEDLTKGNKGIKIKPVDIKNKFHLFLVSKIANPTFDTQTKENLTIKIEDKFELSDKLYKALLKSEIIKSILEWVQLREQAELNKLNKKSAGKTIRVEKLVDAHKAGTNDGYKCALCIAEGDSAKAGVISGLSEVGRDYWGVFPIKGRPLNVRDVAVSKITNNAEIANLMKIIGLVPGKKYTNLNELRYGKLVFFTDADHFGISIKGLLINFIHKMWPELLELGLCYEFVTPIVKATKGKDTKEYYDVDKYKRDKESDKLKGYNTKYYKGLGTITPTEMKQMFKNITKHLIQFKYNSKTDSDKIDMVFNTKRANERKDWMTNYKGEVMPDKFGKPNKINEFIDNEFITFSNYDNVISIPNMIDGLKPSQRKILYGALKKNLHSEIKVAQLGGYIAENTEYHHGESNLFGTIINMAQDFVGANNINYFVPVGQFGNRRDPKSAASPRYIFTYLNPIIKYIIRKEDETILNYLEEEGTIIEPDTYLPVIPMLLVNGTSGIGTGWSTDVPKYNPMSLIQVIKRKLTKPDLKYAINPSYKGWNGDLDWNEEKNTYITHGVFQKTKKGILITELPIDVSTDKYISILDKLCDDKKIKNYIDNSNDETVHIEVILNDMTKSTDVESVLKLTNNISINNMNTFVDTKIVKWNSAEDLLNNWFDFRLNKYAERKASWVKVLKFQFERYANLFAFVKAVVDGELIINNRKKNDIISDLESMEFFKINDSYDYLLNIPVYHLSAEKYEEYKKLAKQMKQDLKEYQQLTPEDIWKKDLEELEEQLQKAGY